MTISLKSNESLRLMSFSDRKSTLSRSHESGVRESQRSSIGRNAFLSQADHLELVNVIHKNSRALFDLTKLEEPVLGFRPFESVGTLTQSGSHSSDQETIGNSSPDKKNDPVNSLNEIRTLWNLQNDIASKIQEKQDLSWLLSLGTVIGGVSLSVLENSTRVCDPSDKNSLNSSSTLIFILRIASSGLALGSAGTFWVKRRINVPKIEFDPENYCYTFNIARDSGPKILPSKPYLVSFLPKSSQSMYSANQLLSKIAAFNASNSAHDPMKKQQLVEVANKHTEGSSAIIGTYLVGLTSLMAAAALNIYYAQSEFESGDCNATTIQSNITHSGGEFHKSSILPLTTAIIGSTSLILNRLIKCVTERASDPDSNT